MLDPVTDPALRPTLPLERSALLPPPPRATSERVVHLQELGRLIGELEQWRRAQTTRLARVAPPSPPAAEQPQRWLFVRAPSGATIRVRFEAGRPVQLRTSAHDRDEALSIVARALDLPLATRGGWRRDAVALDWVVSISPVQ